MWINKTLLRLLTNHEQFKKLNGSLILDRFDKEERAIIKQLRKYWNDHSEFNMEVFAQKFFVDVPCSESEMIVYRELFKVISRDADPEIAKDIVRQLRLMEFNKEVENVQIAYTTGADVDLFESIRNIVIDFERDIRRDAANDYCDATVAEIIEDHEHGSQLEWKLDCLRRSMPGIRTGMQIIVAMRPGLGKTSFCADNGMHWLKSDLIRTTGRPIVWFNNEGEKIRIKGNFLRSALGRDFSQISELGWERAQELFLEQIGAADRLRIYDVHGRDTNYLERIIEKDKPAVVFWDMLDNVRFTGRLGGADRRDQELEALYQWARECAVKYDFLSIPTSQVSVDGADLQWIPASCLKDSKTGKQGACDSIITIGYNSKPGFERSRYIYIAKPFKGSPLPGAFGDCRTEVVFDAGACRYLDPKTV